MIFQNRESSQKTPDNKSFVLVGREGDEYLNKVVQKKL